MKQKKLNSLFGDKEEGNRTRKFVILGTPRSGTQLLVSYLDNHPAIICHMELFHKNGIYYSEKLDLTVTKKYSLTERDLLPMEFLNTMWQASEKQGINAMGFKFLFYQNPVIYDYILNDKDIKKIIIKRTNILMSYVSAREAERSGTYHMYKYKSKKLNVNESKIEINVDVLVKYINDVKWRRQTLFNKLKETGQQYFEINYLNLNQPWAMRKLLRFIGVPDKNIVLETSLEKVNTRKLKDRISNYKEVANALEDKGLGDYLIEEENLSGGTAELVLSSWFQTKYREVRKVFTKS